MRHKLLFLLIAILFTGQQLVDQINMERANRGLYKLKVNQTLAVTAGLKTQDCIAKKGLSHANFRSIMDLAFDNYRWAGEILAKGYNSATSTVGA